MALLSDDDYVMLEQRGLSHVENIQQRYFVFTNYPLPAGMYNVDACDVLVVIPENYNHDGNDMLWTSPRLARKDGKEIPATEPAGSSNNRHLDGREYCRWSRHWNPGTAGAWRSGKDNIISIQRRIEWAFQHPDTK
jgi:hypothetical protein